MTVSTEVNQAAYTGNGVTTVFPYAFRILNASNLVVTQIDLSGNEQLLILGTDYTVSGAGSYSGGAITLPKALPNAYSIIIARELSVVQETDLRNQGTFFAEVHEDAFDYLTMLIQQFRSWIGLSLRRPTIKSNFYDAKQYRIANLADPVNDQDAVNNRSMRDYVEKMIAGVVGGFGWFIQSGAGAIYRTFQSKMRDIVTVEDFGAVGDGITDDTAAIQNALNSSAKIIMSSGIRKKFYKITDTLLMKADGQTLNLGGSELVMSSTLATKPHIIVGGATQINANKLSNISFTNAANTTVYQILINNVGGFIVEDCVGYGSEGKRPFGFIDITVATVGYIRRNATEGLIDSSVRAKGTDGNANRAVDIAIYDNRFRGASHAVRFGNYTEGLFIRRNIFYAQTSWQLLVEPSSAATALVSGKIQENDFDSPMISDGAIYIQFFKNVQITGNWFSNTSQDPMIRLLNTDSVIIQGNQSYPQAAFLEDGGTNTDTTGNLIVGGKSQIYFTATAKNSTVNANHMSGPSVSCVDTNGHTSSLKVMNNAMFPLVAAVGINYPATTPTTHSYIGNSGDMSVGTGRAVIMGPSPATYIVGPRPEILGFKAGTITNISVNGVQMAVNSNVVIGPLPPASSVSVTYSGSTPGLSILQVM